MFALLKLKVSGFRMLSDDFTIDFVAKARVNCNEDSNEIIRIDKNLYTYSIIAFTGSNSSGKSTTLDLIRDTLILMKTGRWIYRNSDFNSSDIKMHIEFYLDGDIYIYDANILPIDDLAEGQIMSPFCKIINETLKYARYDGKCGKHYLNDLKFDVDYHATGIEDTSKLIFLCKDKSNGYYLPEFSKNGVLVNKLFFESLNFLGNELTMEIIRLLDDSIEYINFDGTDSVILKRFNSKEMTLTKKEVLSVLSNGTIKGIDLYIRVAILLKNGGIMVIDEIENCFHKNLVNNLLFLITDKTLNKNNAQIIFSTHYVEILDIFDRRDNIFILHKINNEIFLENLYEDYEFRTEILKSKKFNNNTFNTLLNYDQLMKVKRLLKNEIFGND
ncbi:MAG: ATP-binding protein [Bacilli bacterium]|nr:ATP-binding protein [Bacilli bacterium]